MDLVTRKATEADVPVLVHILNEANQHKLRHNDTIWGTTDWTADEVRERLEIAAAYLFFIGDEAIGTVTLQWEDITVWGPMPPDAGYIHRLAVKEGFHGQGIGTKIMDWAADQIAQKDRKFLRLDCPADNPKLCAYYEANGFKKLEDRLIPAFDDYLAALYELTV